LGRIPEESQISKEIILKHAERLKLNLENF